jgi:NDP-mannose synthase
MEAVILAGGKGSRLRPFTITLPKPLMPVGERPILEIVINQLKANGVTKITVAVNHMADLIMAFFGSGEKLGIEIKYSIEEKALGTVAPVKLIKDLPEHFIVMNGDILTDIDYNDLFHAHIKSEALFTIATFQRETMIDFGVLDVENKSNRVTGFHEKPIYHFDVSMGIYVFSRALLEFVPFNIPYGIDDLVLDMLKNNMLVNAYPYKGYWLDIGRLDDYDQANRDIGKIIKEDNN